MSKTKKRVSRLPPFLYQSDISFAVNKDFIPGEQETSFPLVAKLRPRHISKKNICLQGYFSADNLLKIFIGNTQNALLCTVKLNYFSRR